MKPTQKELNEFVLDLVEFTGKHFQGYFDKIKVAGGNEGVSVRILRLDSDSELEITTDRLDPQFIFGSMQWNYREFRQAKGDLFSRLMFDLSGVITDRVLIISAYRGKDLLSHFISREAWDDGALGVLRKKFPDCDKIEVKKWSQLTETVGAIIP